MLAVQPQSAGPEVEQVDLERVARLGALDRDRAVDLVDALEVEPREVVDRRRRGQLAAARVEAVERDRAARRTVAIGGIAGSQARWDWSRVTWKADAVVAIVVLLGGRGHRVQAAELLDPDGGGLELGRAGLRVRGVDRQQVRRDVVLEVQGHERQPGPQRLVDPDRHLDLAAPRDDPDPLAVGQPVARSASSGEMSSDSPRRSGDV